LNTIAFGCLVRDECRKHHSCELELELELELEPELERCGLHAAAAACGSVCGSSSAGMPLSTVAVAHRALERAVERPLHSMHWVFSKISRKVDGSRPVAVAKRSQLGEPRCDEGGSRR
jgi:hypothetical protein